MKTNTSPHPIGYVAKVLGIKPAGVRALIEDGSLKTDPASRGRRITRKSLDAFVASIRRAGAR